MVRALPLLSAILILYVLSPCAAQDLVPVIRLSVDETAEAQRLVHDVEIAQERVSKANIARQAFYQTFQAAHPELPNLKFTSDFRMAFAPARLDSVKGLDRIDFVELTSEKQQKLRELHEEVNLSRQNSDQTRTAWLTFQQKVVMGHVEKPGSVSPIVLHSGGQLMFPAGWTN
jgi:hypothetical protein